MKINKYFYVSIAILLVLMVSSSCSSLESEDEKNVDRTNREVGQVGGLLAVVDNPPLDVGLEFFYNLSPGITYQEIVSEIGSFTGSMGSGWVRFFYAVGDVFVTMSFTLDENGSFDRLMRMDVYDSERKLYTIMDYIFDNDGNIVPAP